MKLSLFKCLPSEKEDCFQAFLSYRRPHFGLLDGLLKVAYGNNASFAENQTTFWVALPSWFRKHSTVLLRVRQTTRCTFDRPR